MLYIPTAQELENVVQTCPTEEVGRHDVTGNGTQCPCVPEFKLLGVADGVRQFGTIHRMDY